MVEVSVLMPLYKTKYISWLAFESLIRQKDIDFEWELIVIEENTEEFTGKNKVESYKNKLSEVGCVKLTYIPLNKWISLSTKYFLLSAICDINSLLWTIAVGDYYSAPNRLKICYDSFIEHGWDFYRTKRLIYYNIHSGKLAERRISDRGSCCKAVRINIAKQVYYPEDRVRGLDGHFYRQCKIVKPDLVEFVEPNDYWRFGLNTHGFNNLSTNRGAKIDNLTNMFESSNLCLKDVLPIDIVQRIDTSKLNLSKHREGL